MAAVVEAQVGQKAALHPVQKQAVLAIKAALAVVLVATLTLQTLNPLARQEAQSLVVREAVARAAPLQLLAQREAQHVLAAAAAALTRLALAARAALAANPLVAVVAAHH